MNIEYKNKFNEFPIFFSKNKNKKILIVTDINTVKYFQIYNYYFNKLTKNINLLTFENKHLIPNETAYNAIYKKALNSDYILTIGSGTINDLAKAVSTELKIECGVMPTAPSMDGYASSGAAIIKNGKKITVNSHAPDDIIIDLDIIKDAPKDMLAAGFGDIIGKYTSLMDWQLSNLINDEPINKKSFNMMNEALLACVNSFNSLVNNESKALEKLMDALIISGLSIKENGNSRPASGSEHHFSHYLEMDFIKKNKPIPLHGIKVSIGSLISLTMYNYLLNLDINLKNKNQIDELIKKLPNPNDISQMLLDLDSPIKFSDIGVDLDTFKNMIFNAYKVRDRFTVHTLLANSNLLNNVLDDLINKYY